MARLKNRSNKDCLRAGVAQPVERNLAKVEAASSNLVSRSIDVLPAYDVFGGMAEWLCSGLQSRGRRFDSDSRLRILTRARMVKLVDTKDLKSFASRRAGSNPAPGISFHGG